MAGTWGSGCTQATAGFGFSLGMCLSWCSWGCPGWLLAARHVASVSCQTFVPEDDCEHHVVCFSVRGQGDTHVTHLE